MNYEVHMKLKDIVRWFRTNAETEIRAKIKTVLVDNPTWDSMTVIVKNKSITINQEEVSK